MKEKAEAISLISIIFSVMLFIALPIQDLWYSVTLFCFGFVVALIKKMWVTAGWASDKIEGIK